MNHVEWLLIALIYAIVIAVVYASQRQQRREIVDLKREVRVLSDDRVDAQTRIDIARLRIEQALDTRVTSIDPLLAARDELDVHYLYRPRLTAVGGRHR